MSERTIGFVVMWYQLYLRGVNEHERIREAIFSFLMRKPISAKPSKGQMEAYASSLDIVHFILFYIVIANKNRVIFHLRKIR